MITVADLKNTANYEYFCQWEWRTNDGRFIYVRYRWDQLTIDVAANMDKAISGDDEDTEIYERFLGPCLLTYARLRALTRHLIQWPKDDE